MLQWKPSLVAAAAVYLAKRNETLDAWVRRLCPYVRPPVAGNMPSPTHVSAAFMHPPQSNLTTPPHTHTPPTPTHSRPP